MYEHKQQVHMLLLSRMSTTRKHTLTRPRMRTTLIYSHTYSCFKKKHYTH
jgi:hypothetical protein